MNSYLQAEHVKRNKYELRCSDSESGLETVLIPAKSLMKLKKVLAERAGLNIILGSTTSTQKSSFAGNIGAYDAILDQKGIYECLAGVKSAVIRCLGEDLVKDITISVLPDIDEDLGRREIVRVRCFVSSDVTDDSVFEVHDLIDEIMDRSEYGDAVDSVYFRIERE